MSGARAGTLFVLAASVLWGTTGTAAAFIPQVSGLVVGAVSMGLSGLILALLSARSLGALLRAPGAATLVAVGGSAFCLTAVSFYVAMTWAGVALGTVIAVGSPPIFVGLIERILDRKRLSARWLTAVAVTTGGGALLVGARQGFGQTSAIDSHQNLGIAAALVAGLAYAVVTYAAAKLIVPSARRPDGVRESLVVASMQGIAALPLLAIAFFAGMPPIGDVPAWSVLLYIAFVGSAAGFVLYAYGLARIDASSAAVYSLLEPVVAAVLAVVLLHEALGILGWVGVVMVIAGLAVLAVPRDQRSRETAAHRRGVAWVTDRLDDSA